MIGFIRRFLIGRPLPTWRQKHERLPKFLALPVFASDAISSNAYATEEILLIFALAGSGAMAWKLAPWITLAIVLLLGIVVVSYRLTIFSYPHGGGSYIVTRENLGKYPGLVAAASLLTDYVLTVAVSISSGVAAIISAYPILDDYRVLLAIAAVGLVALGNLRGLRESGMLFAVPTYAFVFGMGVMIITGLFKVLSGAEIHQVHAQFSEQVKPITGAALYFLVLRAFASGCTAMTGTEAVADGIPAFRAPESKNAAATLVIMAGILAFLFLGISTLAGVYHAVPYENGHPTIVSQIVEGVFGRSWFYYFIQWSTALILVLAANTAYQDFPRLSSILARDRFAPRQLASIGDRLVFNNGILMLSLAAGILVVLFKASVSALIPLYAVGVFISFTLSQYSMRIRLRKLKQPGWKIYSNVSLFGAIVTGIVAVVIGGMKFIGLERLHIYGRLSIPTGAWMALLSIVVIVYILAQINKHYLTVGEQLRIHRMEGLEPIKTTAIVLVAGVHKGVLPALEYARSLSHDCRALYTEIDPTETALVRDRWEEFQIDMPLVIIESPYRSVNEPVLKYLEEVKKERPNYIVTVVVPEFVPAKWWQNILHNQSALLLKVALLFRQGFVVTNVRYYLEK